MSDYKVLFEVLIIIIVIILVFFLTRLIVSILRSKRLEDYSISPKGNDFNLEKKLWKYINDISDVLNYIIYMEDAAKKYEKYIKSGEEEYKRPIDYITIKIVFALMMVVLYTFELGLQGLNFNFFVFLLILILGFMFPDLLFMIEDKKKRKFVSGDILKAVIIMSNSFKSGRNAYQAVSDVIDRCDGAIQDEFIHVRDDLDHGLGLGDALGRLYERVPDNDVLYLANVLKLVNKSGLNISNAFDNVEQTIINKKRERDSINNIKNANRIFRNVLVFIPLILFLIVIILNKDYQMLLFGTFGGWKIIAIEVLIYVIYVAMVNSLVRRN